MACDTPEPHIFSSLDSCRDDLPPPPKKKSKKISKPKHTKPKFDLEKLKDPNVLETFQAMIGSKFAPLAIMSNEDTDID